MMQYIEKYNSFILGASIGLATIIVGYGIVSIAFEGLVSIGLMDEAYGAGFEKRNRTIWLISICCNAIGIQLFNRRKLFPTQKGIAVSTVVAAAVWVFYYKDSLFFIED